MCTLFQLAQHPWIVGKSYDAPWGFGVLFTQRRGMTKTALIAPPETPARWTARYGSLTLSQVGKGLPVCGINEAGLVVEQATLWGTRYPDRDARPAVGELEWIQYILDTCATVAEALQRDAEVRIGQASVGQLHYGLFDAGGDAAIIEYHACDEVIYTQGEIPHRVLANDVYTTDLNYLEIHQGYGGRKAPAAESSSLSLDRFVRAVAGVQSIEATDGEIQPARAFALLDRLAFEETQWQVVYEQASPVLHLRAPGREAHRTFALSALDFAPTATPLALEIADALAGAAWAPYTVEVNRRLARRFYDHMAELLHAPRPSPAAFAALVTYPDRWTPA